MANSLAYFCESIGEPVLLDKHLSGSGFEDRTVGLEEEAIVSVFDSFGNAVPDPVSLTAVVDHDGVFKELLLFSSVGVHEYQSFIACTQSGVYSFTIELTFEQLNLQLKKTVHLMPGRGI